MPIGCLNKVNTMQFEIQDGAHFAQNLGDFCHISTPTATLQVFSVHLPNTYGYFTPYQRHGKGMEKGRDTFKALG
jgi:hypothetical protein